MRIPGLLAVIVSVVGVAAGQAGSTAMGGMEMEPVPPPAFLPAPVRMTGVGNAHITIKATPEAQVWFDQGLNLLHDFWDYESAKAFEQAVRVDPHCAMCAWGLAQAEGFRGGAEKSYGNKALDEALRLKGSASGTNKLYIEALVAERAEEEGSVKTPKGKEAESVRLYRKLVKKEPKDAMARVYLANALGDGYDDKGVPKPQEAEKIAILEAVLRDAPNDSAANHYYIHALEPSNHPEKAIPSAALLASLAPASGHMVHMPGHIYYRVGDYADADRWFAASTNTDEQYMRDQHVGPDDDWNYVHNMMFAIANLLEQGRLRDADALSDRLAGARGRLTATLYVWSARDQMARVSNRLPAALRVGDWDAVVRLIDAASVPDGDRTVHLRLLTASLRDYAVGMRALAAGDVEAARMASARLDAALWREEQDRAAVTKKDGPTPDAKKDAPPMNMVMPDAEASSLVSSLKVASLELRAGLLVADGRLPDGKALYARATADEKKLGYHEPPIYVRPVGETEAEALLRAKDYAGARAAYEEALEERPKSGFGLYGLAHVAEMQGDLAGAQAGYQTFLHAWDRADLALPEVVHARQIAGVTATAANAGAGASHP